MKKKLDDSLTEEERDKLLIGLCQIAVEMEKQIATLAEKLSELIFLITPPEGEC